LTGKIISDTKEKTDNKISSPQIIDDIEPKPLPEPCIPKWFCDEWSECINGTQTRNCTDKNNCDNPNFRPIEVQECQSCPESCDDGNPCTNDYCNYNTNYECRHDEIIPCCGNNICETGEEYGICSDCTEEVVFTCNSKCKGLGQEINTYGYITSFIDKNPIYTLVVVNVPNMNVTNITAGSIISDDILEVSKCLIKI